MKKNSVKLLVLTPVYGASYSGAGVYYELLCNYLTDHSIPITVVSEIGTSVVYRKHLKYIPLLPRRSSRNKRLFVDYLLYAYQNAMYFRLTKILKKENPGVVLVHSSFFNYPNALYVLLILLKKKHPNIYFVADVRDRLLPRDALMKTLGVFDCIIACSENVENYLKNGGIRENSISPIPIPHFQYKNQHDIKILIKHELLGKHYILYVGLIKELKSVDKILEAYHKIIKPKMPHVKLVLAGLVKTKSAKIRNLMDDKNVFYLGNVRNEDAQVLMSKAELCINISKNEGMPRVSLEALSVGKKVVLPPNVPEFERYANEFVYHGDSVQDLGNFMMEKMKSNIYPAYPMERHSIDAVGKKYIEVLKLK